MKTINAANINQAVAYANLSANKSVKRCLAYRICLPLCSTLFFLLSVILTYGAVDLFVLRPLSEQAVSTAVSGLPIISDLWEAVFYKIAFLLGTVTVWYRFVALCAVLLFTVPAVAALTVLIVVSLVCHPDTSGSDIHVYEEHIEKKLYQKAESAAKYRWGDARLILPFSLLFTAGAAALAVHIELAALSPEDRGQIVVSTIMNLFLAVIGSGLLLALYACLMYMSLRLWEVFVAPRMNTAFVDACRDYWEKNDPELIKQRKEAEEREAEAARRRAKEAAEKAEAELAAVSAGPKPTVFISDVVARMEDSSFDAESYVRTNCKYSLVHGIPTDEDKQKIDSDPNLSARQKESAKRELESRARYYF